MIELIAASALMMGIKSVDLGKAEGRCRPDESGPAFIVDVAGLKDRKGNLKLEIYPANDKDFLEDDRILVNAGKVFRRVEVPVPANGQLCVRVPRPGTYAVSILHDRDSNRKFGLSTDGIAFAGNPKLGMSKPKAASASARAGSGITRLRVVMNYRTGLVSFGPLKRK